MTITRIKLENFTVFESLDLEPSPGINVLVGANGTGKTHLMKVCYATRTFHSYPLQMNYGWKLLRVFLPSGNSNDRLLRNGCEEGLIEIKSDEGDIWLHLAKQVKEADFPSSNFTSDWESFPFQNVYIPAKEILSNAPGFRSLYASREVHFEETYQDILDRAYLPPLRNPSEYVNADILSRLEDKLGGKVTVHGEEFFLSNEQGEIEFTLLAEGLRKLGLLWLLIRNGSLKPGAVLFWDEPEANLNPKLYGVVIDVLLELQRVGVQIFLATHDYVILKELDLQAKEGDKLAFHSLHRSEETGEIVCRSTNNFLQIHPNAISEVFDSIYDRDVRRALEGIVK